jgi:hypothetical protein
MRDKESEFKEKLEQMEADWQDEHQQRMQLEEELRRQEEDA